MLIPIGAWCRTAFQVKQFLNKEGLQHISFPFDWTITPYRALEKTLCNDFEQESILLNENLEISKVGSILDGKTDIIFHHDLSPKIVTEKSIDGRYNERGVPMALLESNLIKNARNRFLHTYSHLPNLMDGQRAGFVRWNRFGHPDRRFPNAFDGENIETLHSLLTRFLGHNDFSVLHVITEYGSSFSGREIVKELHKNQFGMRAVIRERRGFNGNGKNDFRGDTRSWSLLLSLFVNEFAIDMSSYNH